MKTIERKDTDTVIIDGHPYVRVEAQGRKPWPQEGDAFFALHPDGYVEDAFRIHLMDEQLANWLNWAAQGHLFATRDEAEAERDRRAAEHRVMQAWREMIAPHKIESKGFVYHSLFEAMYARSVPNDGGVPDTIAREMPDDVRRMMG